MVKNNVTKISDQFLKRIYDSGNWSIISFFIIVIMMQFNGSFIVYSSTFTAASIDFQCQTNGSSSSHVIQKNTCNYWNNETNQLESCSINYTFLPRDNFVSSSIISHFMLVCDRSHLDELSQSLVIWGLVIGGFIGPITGDYFGRQKVMLCSTFLCGIFGVLLAFSPNFLIFAIGKCVLGTLREISMTTGIVLAMENIPSNKQSLFGMLNQLIWCFTILFIGTLAFFVRDWQYLQIIGSSPSLFAPILIIIISESPRWLISKGKILDLENMIKLYIVKWNTVNMNEFEDLMKKLKSNKELLLITTQSEKIKQYSILDIFRSRYLIFWTLILTFTWVYGVTAIYSLNSMTTLLAGNPYLNYCVSGLLDGVGVIVAFYVMGTSRNISVLTFQIICSISFLTAGFLPPSLKYLTTCLIILGKMSLNGNLYVITLSALYIYPSSLRIFGSTISCTLGKVVATCSPYLIELFKIKMWLPTTILGICALLVAILNIFFPDWINKPLPETIEDVEELKSYIFLPCCSKEYEVERTEMVEPC